MDLGSEYRSSFLQFLLVSSLLSLFEESVIQEKCRYRLLMTILSELTLYAPKRNGTRTTIQKKHLFSTLYTFNTDDGAVYGFYFTLSYLAHVPNTSMLNLIWYHIYFSCTWLILFMFNRNTYGRDGMYFSSGMPTKIDSWGRYGSPYSPHNWSGHDGKRGRDGFDDYSTREPYSK